MTDVEVMLRAYIECALWSSNDESDDSGGDPLDKNYSAEDLAPETLAKMREDCEAFLTANLADIENGTAKDSEEYTAIERAGHDFWLTRNGHGAGFWDGDLPEELGERLTKAAKAFGEVNLYVENGKIYDE